MSEESNKFEVGRNEEATAGDLYILAFEEMWNEVELGGGGGEGMLNLWLESK